MKCTGPYVVGLTLATTLSVATCNKLPTGPDGQPIFDGAYPINQTIPTNGPFSMFLEKMSPNRGETATVGSKARIWANIRNTHDKLKLVYEVVVVNGPSDTGSGRPTSIFEGWRELMPGEPRTGQMGTYTSVAETIPWLRYQGCYVDPGRLEGGCPRNAAIEVLANVEVNWTFR